MATYTEPELKVFPALEITAVSTDGGLEIFYGGGEKYADVAVAAGGDITVRDGASLAAAAVEVLVGLPTVGTGIIDVSDASADTIGEVIDHFNKSTKWRVRPLAMRRADSSNNTLITRSAAQCNLAAVTLLRDSTVAVQTNTYTIGVRVAHRTVRAPISGGFTNHLTQISGVASVTTPGSGSGYDDGDGALDGLNVVVYSVNDILKTQRRVWYSQITSGAAFDFTEADWGNQPLAGDPGEDLLVLIQNSGTGATTITSPTLKVQGYRTQDSGSRTQRFSISNI